ncbi:MAG: signal recognition particle protein, partial [Celeribacter marinus]
KMGKGGMLKQAVKGMFGKGGPQSLEDMDPAKMAEATRAIQSGLPGNMPAMSNLPGLGGSALPPGLSGFGKKK